MNILETYDVVFFDLFFTLINMYEDEANKIHEATILGVPMETWYSVTDSQLYERSIGVVSEPLGVIRNIVEKIKPDVSDTLLKEVLDARVKRVKTTVINVDKRNLKVLYQLKAMGKKLCLVSNADVIDTIGWSESPLADIFDEVIFSCDVKLAKPSAEIYEYAMKQVGATAGQCIFVGDGGSDELRGAKEVGITTVLTTQYRGDLWPDTIDKISINADYVISDLEELLG